MKSLDSPAFLPQFKVVGELTYQSVTLDVNKWISSYNLHLNNSVGCCSVQVVR